MTYVRKLRFEETPDYEFLVHLFDKVLADINETDDGVYDWMLLKNTKRQEVNKPPFLWYATYKGVGCAAIQTLF